MSDDERRLLEEVDFWLRLNNDHLRLHRRLPTRRMQEALFHALDLLRAYREALDAARSPSPERGPGHETLN